MNEVIQKVRLLVIENELEEAFTFLGASSQIESKLLNELNLLKSRVNAHGNDKRKGLITDEDARVEGNKIRLSFFELLDVLANTSKKENRIRKSEDEDLDNLISSEAEMNYRLGNQKFVNGEFEKAIHYYQLAIELKPDFFKAHANIHLSYEKVGRIKKSEIHRNIATKINTYAVDFGTTNTHIAYMESNNIEIAKSGFEKLRNSENPAISKFAKLNLKEIEKMTKEKKEKK